MQRSPLAAFAGVFVVTLLSLVAVGAVLPVLPHYVRGPLGSGNFAVGLVIGAFAFDAVFELFHRLFFAGGTYTFDARTDRLVQLFPDQFWFETSLALGALMVLLCLVAWRVATERVAAGVSRRPSGSPMLEPSR